MIKLCVVTTLSKTLCYLHRGQFEYLKNHGFEVWGVAGPGDGHEQLHEMGVPTKVIPMTREITPLRDLIALIRLWWFFLTNRFDVVHFSTTKAAFLSSIASLLAGVRRRFYTCRGRLYLPESSLKYKIFIVYQRFVFRLCTRCIFICHELKAWMVHRRLCPPTKGSVIGSGSSNGVDLKRFSRTEYIVRKGMEIRQELGLNEDGLMILSVGRLRREKGINELVEAYTELAEDYPNVHLLLVGNYEQQDSLKPETLSSIDRHPRIHRIKWITEPSAAYAAADIVAFPTYQEGFGNVSIEASAMGVPVVSTDILGCRESTENGVTGILVPPEEAAPLRDALKRLIDDPAMRRRLGANGRKRVEREFPSERIWQGMVQQYRSLMDVGQFPDTLAPPAGN